MKTRAQRAQEAAQEQAILIGTSDNDTDSIDSGYSTDSTMDDKKSKSLSHYMPADQLEPAGDDYTTLDVLTFRYFGGNVGTKVGEYGDPKPGIKFAFFFDTTTSYRIRTGDPTAEPPKRPPVPELKDNPSTTDLRVYKQEVKVYKEWDYMEIDAKEFILNRFPSGCLHLLDSRTGTFSIEDSPKFILDEIQRRASTPRELNAQHGQLTSLMKDMEYAPTRNGPVKYMRDMTLYMDRANELLLDTNLPVTMILNWMLAAFDRSGHNKVSLGQCHKKWEEVEEKFLDELTTKMEAEANAAAAESRDPKPLDKDQLYLRAFKRFWVDELANLYRLEGAHQGKKHQAQLAHQANLLSDEVSTVKALQATLQDKICALKTAPPVPVVHASDRTVGTIGTIVTPEFQSALNAVQTAYKEELHAPKASIQALAAQQRQPAYIAPPSTKPLPSPATATTASNRNKSVVERFGWRKYDKWCWECGVNLGHNSPDCKARNTRAHKYPEARWKDPKGGNMEREHLWGMYHHPLLTKAQPTPHFPTN